MVRRNQSQKIFQVAVRNFVPSGVAMLSVHRLCAVNHVSVLVLQTTLNGALDTIAAAARELVSARHVIVLLMDHARQMLWTSIIDNQSISGASLSFRVKEGQGVLAQCAVDKEQVTMSLAVSINNDAEAMHNHDVL